MPVVTIALAFLVVRLVDLGIIPRWLEELLEHTLISLFASIPLCIIAGIVFGVLGLREGERRYSITGLVLNTLIIVGVPALIAIAIVAGW